METIRDACNQWSWDSVTSERKTVVHEIGHEFGYTHDELAIMDQGYPLDEYFSDWSRKRIREILHP